MKIYKSKIPTMAEDIAQHLMNENAIEVNDEEKDEFNLDLQSILRTYVDTDRRIHEEAQQVLTARNLDFGSFHRVKRDVAKKYNFAIGDDAIDWITDQIIEMLYHTSHVEEVWADNNDIRRISRNVINKYSTIDNEVDVEVRKRIKNLSEGSLAWDAKYNQVLEEIRRSKGLI